MKSVAALPVTATGETKESFKNIIINECNSDTIILLIVLRSVE